MARWISALGAPERAATTTSRRPGRARASKRDPVLDLLGDPIPPEPGEQQDGRPDNDGRIGQIEHRPYVEIDEVDHLAGETGATDEPIRQVADRSAQDEAQTHGRD